MPNNPSTVSLALVAAVATGVASAQAVAGAGNLTLNGSLTTAGVATTDVARRIIITSANAGDGAIVFTLVGTDRYGNVQQETITGVTTTPVASVRDYKTVTRIGVSGATAGNISAGTNTTGSTDWIVDNYLVSSWSLSFFCTLSGTATYSVETTCDDPNAGPNSGLVGINQFGMNPGSFSPPAVFPGPTTLTAATASIVADMANRVCFAHRLTITSGTGTVTMQSIQAGMRSW